MRQQLMAPKICAMSLLTQAYDPEAFRRQGHALVEQLALHLEQMQQAPQDHPAIPYLSPQQALTEWTERLAVVGDADPNTLFGRVLAQSVRLHHPHYLGHQISPPAPVAALAGLVSDFLNNGMGVYEMGMAGTAIEQTLVTQVAQVLGFGPEAGGFITSGGTLANLTALLTARSVVAPTPVWTEGATGRLALMVSEEAHYCVDRAARIMGWGEAGVIKVPSDERFAIRTDLLELYYQQALAEGIQVVAVVGSACATAAGAFDDLTALADFCERHQLWLHVDGAHGAALAFSESYRGVLAGLERADSVAMDFHKMLLTPSVATALIYRRDQHSYATFQQRAAYLLAWEANDDWHNLARRTFECTKLMLGLKAYVLWATYGPGLFNEYVTRVCDLGRAFGRLVEADPQLELLTPPQCNIVCYRFAPAGIESTQADALNLHIRQTLLEQGDFYVLSTTIRERVWLRSTISNASTTEAHLSDLLARIKKIGKEAFTIKMVL